MIGVHKRIITAFLALALVLGLFAVPAQAWKPITHADEAQKAVEALAAQDPGNPLLAKLIGNLDYLRAGSAGPDIFYSLFHRRARAAILPGDPPSNRGLTRCISGGAIDVRSVRAGLRLSFPFRDLVRRLRPVVFGVAIATAGTGILAASEPQGAPINDPEMAALLRPSDPIVEEHLTLGNDGNVYYSAKLKHFAMPGFTKRYLAELENRGVRITPLGSSPHVVPQRVIGYDFLAWQEASLNPYSIRFREGKDREETMVREPPGRPNYPDPVSVTGDRVVVRLPAEFARPWRIAVVVPAQSEATLPFPVPLPADAVVRGATEDKDLEWVDGKSRPGAVRAVRISLISKLAPADVRRFFKERLKPWGRVIREETSTTWRFDRIPPWAPSHSEGFYLAPQDSLFGTPGGHGVSDAQYASAFQAKTLPHLPRDVHNYWISVLLKRESVK